MNIALDVILEGLLKRIAERGHREDDYAYAINALVIAQGKEAFKAAEAACNEECGPECPCIKDALEGRR